MDLIYNFLSAVQAVTSERTNSDTNQYTSKTVEFNDEWMTTVEVYDGWMPTVELDDGWMTTVEWTMGG